MPAPKAREKRSAFVGRCVPVALREPGTKSTAHAVAKCGGIWDQARKKRLAVNQLNPLRIDPTRTTMLRRRFQTDLSKRFQRLKRAILELVVDSDAFGLKQYPFVISEERDDGHDSITEGLEFNAPDAGEETGSDHRVAGESVEASADSRAAWSIQRRRRGRSRGGGQSIGEQGRSVLVTHKRVTIYPTGRWQFLTDPQKVKEFNQWLQTQVQGDILTVTAHNAEDAYWRAYVEEGYRKGAGRAFDDTRAAQRAASAWTPDETAFYAGSKEEFLRSSFARPVAIEKVKLLTGRVFTDLKGVTEAMAATITRELADGLVQGQHPTVIARRMIKNGIGTKVRGVQSRALTIARTEVIRAHAEGQLDAMEQLGVTEVGVMVEWSTAEDSLVCELCASMGGAVMKITEARGLIPRHPNCRCAYTPAGVGESTIGQKRSKEEIQQSIDASIRAEMPKKKKRTFAEQKERTRWAGADKAIAKTRPKAIV